MIFDGMDLKSEEVGKIARDIIASYGGDSNTAPTVQAFGAQGSWTRTQVGPAAPVTRLFDIGNPAQGSLTTTVLSSQFKRAVYMGSLRWVLFETIAGAIATDEVIATFGVQKGIPPFSAPYFPLQRRSNLNPITDRDWIAGQADNVSFTYLANTIATAGGAGLNVDLSTLYDFDGVVIRY